jgi:hypothetical protein
MNKQNELRGTVVLVKPNLINDHSGKKNKVGTIVMASIESDNVMVNFGLEGNAFFSAKDLLVMRKPVDIERSANLDATLLPFYDYNDILEILAFAEHKDLTYRRHAVELSKKCPDILEYTMERLSDALDLKRTSGISY